MARYITHIAIPSKIIRMLECAMRATDPEDHIPLRFCKSIHGIGGCFVHVEISARASEEGIETEIALYNSAGVNIFTASSGYFIGSHDLVASMPGDSDTYEVIIEEQTDELVDKISKEEDAEKFLLKKFGEELRGSKYVTITYYTYIPEKWDVLVSMSNDQFSFRKIKY